MIKKSIYEDGTYLLNSPDWHQADSQWKAERIASFLAMNSLHPTCIGEIGCGAGEVLRCLGDLLGHEVSLKGYDISPQAIELARPKERSRLTYVVGDLLHAPPEITFELLMAIDVFEHVEDCFEFLRKMRTRGRYKVFHIPLDLSAQSVLRAGRLLQSRASVGHIHYYTKELALATLADTGYEIVDFAYTCGSIERSSQSWKATLARFPRRLLFWLNPDFAARLLGGFSLLVLAR